jgi:hypothetical protein
MLRPASARVLGMIAVVAAVGAIVVAVRCNAESGRRTPVGSRDGNREAAADASSAIAVGDGGVWVTTRDGLARIDAASSQVVSRIPVGRRLAGVAVGMGAVWATDPTIGTVFRIDPSTNDLVATVHVPGAGAVALGEGAVWITGRDGLTRVDPATNRTLAVIRTPAATSLAVGAGAVWLAGAQAVTRIDAAKNRVVARIEVPGGDPTVAVGGGAVWVTGSQLLYEIDPSTNRLKTRISDPSGGAYLAVGEGAVWIRDKFIGKLSKVDLDANRVTAIIDGGEGGRVAAGAGSVWLVNVAGDIVSRVDPIADRWVDDIMNDPTLDSDLERIDVGQRPLHIAVGERAVWVADPVSDSLFRLDPVTRRIVAEIEVAGAIQVAVGEGAVWVRGRDGVSRVASISGRVRPGLGAGGSLTVGERGVWAIGSFGQSAGLVLTNILRIDPLTNEQEAVTSAEDHAVLDAREVTAGEGAVWVAGGAEGVSRIDARTKQLVATVRVFQATEVAVGEGAVWAAGVNEIARIDPATNRVAARVPVRAATDIAVGEGSVWATTADGHLSQIDPVANRVVDKLEVGWSPRHLAVGEGYVWIAYAHGDIISRVRA